MARIVKDFIIRNNYYVSMHAQHTQEWHNLRKYRIMASEVGAIIGKSKFKTPEQVADNITGVNPYIFDESALERMKHGTDTEPLIRQWAETELSELYSTKVSINEIGVAIPTWDTYLGASVDGECYLPNGMEINCEFKAPKKMYYALKQRIINDKYNKNTNDHSHIFDSYYYQMQMQMAITNRKKCFFVVYATDDELVYSEFVDFNQQEWDECYRQIQIFKNKYLKDYTPIMPI